MVMNVKNCEESYPNKLGIVYIRIVTQFHILVINMVKSRPNAADNQANTVKIKANNADLVPMLLK